MLLQLTISGAWYENSFTYAIDHAVIYVYPGMSYINQERQPSAFYR